MKKLLFLFAPAMLTIGCAQEIGLTEPEQIAPPTRNCF